MGAGRYEEALAAFEDAVEHDPDYLEARTSPADALLMLGRYDDRKHNSEAAIDPDLDNVRHRQWFRQLGTFTG